MGGWRWICTSGGGNVEQLLPPPHTQKRIVPPLWQILDARPAVDTLGSHQFSLFAFLSSSVAEQGTTLALCLTFFFSLFLSFFFLFYRSPFTLETFFYTDGAVSVSNYLLYYF